MLVKTSVAVLFLAVTCYDDYTTEALSLSSFSHRFSSVHVVSPHHDASTSTTKAMEVASFSSRRQRLTRSYKSRSQVKASSSSYPDSPSNKKDRMLPSKKAMGAISSTAGFIALDVAFRRFLTSMSITFPSSLIGCGALFASLLLANAAKKEWGDKLYSLFNPGAAVLALWLPLFFVPSLVILPLAKDFGSLFDIIKVSVVVVGGFYFTLLSAAYSVLGVRVLQKDTSSIKPSAFSATALPASLSKQAKAFPDGTFAALFICAIVSGTAAAVAPRLGAAASITTPLESVFMLFTTLSTFVFGARRPKAFTKIVHPLVTCTILTWIGAKLMGILKGKSFHDMLRSYKVRTLSPTQAGAGDLLLFMLGPAVVSLACQMYNRKKLMSENIFEVATAVTVATLGGLFGTAALVRFLKIGNPILRLCVIPRNITSPLAMAIANMLGADPSLAVSMVVVTGLIGANFGAAILDALGIKDAVARGLGIGAAAHGIGTASLNNEKDAFPFAAISMALTATACTILVSIPYFKSMLINLAIGG